MPRTTTESIFVALFSLAKTVQGADWNGNPIPLQYSTRNWSKTAGTPDGLLPALYQLDPRQERDVRTGLGRSRRLLHAQLEIRIQREQSDQYSDAQPLATILNNWTDNLYALFSPADGGPSTLSTLPNGGPFNGALPYGAIADCYPVSAMWDYGNDASRTAILYTIIEIVTGG